MTTDEIFRIILLFGASLIILIAWFLWFYPKSFFANKVLALLSLLWGLSVFAFVLQSRSFYNQYPHFLGVASGFSILFFPLMYVFIRTFLYADTRKLKYYWPHGILFLAYIVTLFPFLIKSAEEKLHHINNGLPAWVITSLNIFDIVVILQGIFYTVISVRMLEIFQYFRDRRMTKSQKTVVKWLKQFVIINIILWGIGTAGVVIEVLGLRINVDLFNIYYLGLTMLTLWLGSFTLKHTHIFSFANKMQSLTIKTSVKNTKERTVNDQSKELRALLAYIETDKPYLNNELTLQDLVEAMNMSKNKVSAILNSELDKSFYEVINEYRVKEAIRLIDNGMFKKHTINFISEKAGFNSKATFNRIFKQYTNKTPSEYIESITLVS